MEPENKPEEEKASEQEPNLSDKLKELLDDFPNRPSPAEIDTMKSKHGSVFLSALNDDEVFIFRPLTRKEHRSLNAQVSEGKLAPDAFEETVVKTCLLWASLTDSLDSKAGTLPSLFEQVMQNSNFLAPQLLSNLVTKL